MGCYVISQVVKLMLQKRIHVNNSKILMMGLTFKENCPDLRNTRVTDMIEELDNFGATVDVYDPWVDADEAKHEYGITPVKEPQKNSYDAIILAVGHDEFKKMSVDEVRAFGRESHVLYDIKYLFDTDSVDGRL